MIVREREDTEPWYKQFWPWFIFGLPASVVVASMFTIYLAIISNDGLVIDDYYKEGLAYNKKLERNQLASQLGLSGELLFNPDRQMIEFRLVEHDQQLQQHFKQLTLKLIYATQADQDQNVLLFHQSGGIYRGEYRPLSVGKWHIQLEPESQQWRLKGTFNYPSRLSAKLTPGLD